MKWLRIFELTAILATGTWFVAVFLTSLAYHCILSVNELLYSYLLTFVLFYIGLYMCEE